jgi:hypothetical protein
MTRGHPVAQSVSQAFLGEICANGSFVQKWIGMFITISMTYMLVSCYGLKHLKKTGYLHLSEVPLNFLIYLQFYEEGN